jgi:hypothetical protein
VGRVQDLADEVIRVTQLAGELTAAPIELHVVVQAECACSIGRTARTGWA